MLDVVTFKWKSAPGYRSKFLGQHVNTLASMVKRNYNKPHRFTCITDDPKGIEESIRVIPLWDDFANLQSVYGSRNPSCYRRLKLFSAEAASLIGPRFVSLDLDVVITDDLSPLWDREDDFVILKTPMVSPRYLYNGSMLLMSAGCRKQVWEDFNPNRSPQLTRAKGFFGSDQAWIGLKLGPGEKTWDTSDGVYSWRMHIDGKFSRGVLVSQRDKSLPANAKVVVFHGADDPWGKNAQQVDWVREHYR